MPPCNSGNASRKQYLNKESLDNLHFLYSSIFAGFDNPNSCMDNPDSYKKTFQSKLQEWNCNGPNIFPICRTEVFFYENGLRFANQAILDYVMERDILDIGACEGDSAFVFQNKTKKRIFSYEPNPNNIKIFQSNAQILNFDPKKIF